MKFQYQGWLKFFDNSDVTEETNDCTQYYCYNPAKLLALVRRACPVRRDSSHTNEQSILPRGTNLWVWPEKLDPFRIVTAAATLQPHPFSTLNRAPDFLR